MKGVDVIKKIDVEIKIDDLHPNYCGSTCRFLLSQSINNLHVKTCGLFSGEILNTKWRKGEYRRSPIRCTKCINVEVVSNH